MRRFDEITIRAKATVGVGAEGAGVVHTVIGARLVVVGVHVGHGGWWVRGYWGREDKYTRVAGECDGVAKMDERVVLVMRADDEADVV